MEEKSNFNVDRVYNELKHIPFTAESFRFIYKPLYDAFVAEKGVPSSNTEYYSIIDLFNDVFLFNGDELTKYWNSIAPGKTDSVHNRINNSLSNGSTIKASFRDLIKWGEEYTLLNDYFMKETKGNYTEKFENSFIKYTLDKYDEYKEYVKQTEKQPENDSDVEIMKLMPKTPEEFYGMFSFYLFNHLQKQGLKRFNEDPSIYNVSMFFNDLLEIEKWNKQCRLANDRRRTKTLLKESITDENFLKNIIKVLKSIISHQGTTLEEVLKSNSEPIQSRMSEVSLNNLNNNQSFNFSPQQNNRMAFNPHIQQPQPAPQPVQPQPQERRGFVNPFNQYNALSDHKRVYGIQPAKPSENKFKTEQEKNVAKAARRQKIIQDYGLDPTNPKQAKLLELYTNATYNKRQNPIDSDRNAKYGTYNHLIKTNVADMKSKIANNHYNDWVQGIEDRDLEYNPRLLDRNYAATLAARYGLHVYEGDQNNDGLPDIALIDDNGTVKAYNGYMAKPSKQLQYQTYYSATNPIYNDKGKYLGHGIGNEVLSLSQFNSKMLEKANLTSEEKKALNKSLREAGLHGIKVVNQSPIQVMSSWFNSLVKQLFDIADNTAHPKQAVMKVVRKANNQRSLASKMLARLLCFLDGSALNEEAKYTSKAQPDEGEKYSKYDLMKKILSAKNAKSDFYTYGQKVLNWFNTTFNGIVTNTTTPVKDYIVNLWLGGIDDDVQKCTFINKYGQILENEFISQIFMGVDRNSPQWGELVADTKKMKKEKEDKLKERPAYEARLKGAQVYNPSAYGWNDFNQEVARHMVGYN